MPLWTHSSASEGCGRLFLVKRPEIWLETSNIKGFSEKQ